MTTKEQERIALEKIKKIVEELGEDSYLSYAFEGCFEDAEQNIKDDAAYSWRQRAESAQKELDQVRELADKYKKEAEFEKATCAAKAKTVEWLNDEIKDIRSKMLSNNALRRLFEMVTDVEEQATRSMLSAASMMARISASPNEIGFKHAVDVFRKEEGRKHDAEDLKAMLKRVID